MMRLKAVAPAAALLACGCLASKRDVFMLQNQLSSMQAASARADSAQRMRVEALLSAVSVSNDSVRAISARLARLQSTVATDHYEMGRELLQIQELTGQSQRRLQELRASLEERNQNAAAPLPATSVDTLRPAPAGPGPAQLFQTSLDQMRRGSLRVARSGFEQLLQQYPNSEDAPEAMIYIAATYASERNQVAADSVYGLVVQRYPTSPKAATALYKQALSMREAGRIPQARAAFERIIKDYPRSDEAELARGQLRTLGR